MKNPIDFDLIDRYLAGEATAAERAALEADPAAAAIIAGLRTAPEQWNAEAAWQRTRAQLPRERSRAPWLRIAALLVLALGVGVLLLARGGDSTESVAAAEYQTAAGERRTITLTDGSRIVLAPATHLRVPADFGVKDRAVHLTGEAFFDVAHDAGKHFIVRTRLAHTEVLGTAFNVRAYASDSVTEVALQRGKVGVRPTDSDLVVLMEPGQVVYATALAARYDTTRVDLAAYTSWADGQLTFQDWPLDRIVDRLEAWYGVDIRIADATLARTRVSAFLPAGKLDEVLDAIAETAGAEYHTSGSTITLQRRR